MPLQLSFPSTLGRERHKSIIAFTAITPKDKLAPLSASFGVKPTFGHNDGGTVFLYMPDLGDRLYSQGFESDGMGMMEKIISAFMGDGSLGEKFSAAGTMVGSSLGGDARDKLSTDIANPHTTQRYKGPELRSQTFEFELFPRNQSELVAIRDIIQFFKMNTSTKVGGNTQTVGKDTFSTQSVTSTAGAGAAANNLANNSLLVGDRLKYPDQFLIQELVQNSKAERIMPPFKFGPAYCKSVSVAYNKDGAVFESGDPISYTLKLEFVEATMLTSADISAGA